MSECEWCESECMVSVSGASVSVRCTSGCEWYMVSLSVSGVLVSVSGTLVGVSGVLVSVRGALVGVSGALVGVSGA